jgi:hypothetical protein
MDDTQGGVPSTLAEKANEPRSRLGCPTFSQYNFGGQTLPLEG